MRSGLLVPTHRDRPRRQVVVSGRYFGIHHKNRVFDGMTKDEIRDFKRRQDLR
jgi:hypothetical protein